MLQVGGVAREAGHIICIHKVGHGHAANDWAHAGALAQKELVKLLDEEAKEKGAQLAALLVWWQTWAQESRAT